MAMQGLALSSSDSSGIVYFLKLSMKELWRTLAKLVDKFKKPDFSVAFRVPN
jgi:hypothetical protein